MRRARKRTGAPWRVGVLFAQSGCTSDIEKTQLSGTLLAIEEINAAGGVNGREILPVVCDPGSGAVPYSYLAKKLIVEDGVASIFGCYTSASRKAVMPVVERLNGLLWYPTPYEGFEFSPNIIYTGAALNQTITMLCSYLLETYGKRVYLIGSDYVYPRQTNRFLRDHLVAHGGVAVAERYVAIDAPQREFRPIMQEIKEAGADVIFSTVVGRSTSFLYQAYADAGLDPRYMPIASLTTTEAEIRAMGDDVGEAHITAACYFEGVEDRARSAFASRFKRRFGDDLPPNVCAETAYFQVYIFARALEKSDSADTDDLRPFVLGSSIEAPQGRVRIGSTGHADLWTRIGRANRRGRFDLLFESQAPVPADPFLLCSAAG